MNKLTHSNFFRIISLVLIITFIALDISWAYPPDPSTQNSTLATPSLLQQQPINEKFQQSIFSEGRVLGSVCSIAKYLLDDKLPIKYLDQVLTAELGNAIQNIDLSHVTISKDGAILIPCEVKGKKRIIQIAVKESLAAKDLIGYEWVVSSKYVIRELPEDYKESMVQVVEELVVLPAAKVESKEKPKVSISEPIAQVEVPATKKEQDSGITSKIFNVNAITALTLAVVLLFPQTVFGASGDSTSFFSSNSILYIIGAAVFLVLVYRLLMRNLSPSSRHLLKRFKNAEARKTILSNKNNPLVKELFGYMERMGSDLEWLTEFDIEVIAKCLIERKIFSFKLTPPVYKESSEYDVDTNTIYEFTELDKKGRLEVTEEAAQPKPLEQNTKDSVKLLFINPLAAIFSIAVLGSIFSVLKDFAFAHPIIAGITTLGIGIVAFFAIWRVCFPISWYIHIALSGADYDSRRHAEEALVKIGEPAVPRLLKIISSTNYEDIDSAVKILGNIKDPRAIEPLIELLTTSSRFAESVMMALGNIKDPRAVEPLIKVLTSAYANYLRALAATSLGNIKDQRAEQALVKALTQRGGHRCQANDYDSFVQKEAAESLQKMGWKPTNIKEEIKFNLAGQNWNRLIEIGSPTVNFLREALTLTDESHCAADQYDHDIRKKIMRTLGALGETRDPRAMELLKSISSNDPSVETRVDALESLSTLGEVETVLGAVEQLVRGNDREQFLKLVFILRKIKDPRTVALLKAIALKDGSIASNVADALIEMNAVDSAIETAIEMSSAIFALSVLERLRELIEIKDRRLIKPLVIIFGKSFIDGLLIGTAEESLNLLKNIAGSDIVEPLHDLLVKADFERKTKGLGMVSRLTDEQIEEVTQCLITGRKFNIQYIAAATHVKQEEVEDIHGDREIIDVYVCDVPGRAIVVLANEETQQGPRQLAPHPQAILYSIMQEISQKKELSPQELFTLVQSKIPQSMQNLQNALAELRPLSKQVALTAEAISAAIAQVKARYNLSEEETKILWLALTGPGQEVGVLRNPTEIVGSDKVVIELPVSEWSTYQDQYGFGPPATEDRLPTGFIEELKQKFGEQVSIDESIFDDESSEDDYGRWESSHKIKTILIIPQNIANSVKEVVIKYYPNNAFRISSTTHLDETILSDFRMKISNTAKSNQAIPLDELINFLPQGSALRNALINLKRIQGKPTYEDIQRIIKEDNLNVAEQAAFVLVVQPGQGVGEKKENENSLYIPKSVAEAYAAVIATLHKIAVDHRYPIFEPKIDKNKVEEALLTREITCVGSAIFGYDTGPYSGEEPVTVNFSNGNMILGSVEDYDYGDATRDRLEKPVVTEKAAQPKAGQTSDVTHLFEIVASSVNNTRAEFIWSGNTLISKALLDGLSLGNGRFYFDRNMSSFEIRQGIEHVIAIINSSEKEKVPSETRSATEVLKKNLNQFEADGAVASLIVLARRAKRENQKLIIGLETDWIPGINVKGSLQRNAINALMKEIDSIAEALQSMGLDNVEIIRGSGNQLADTILNKAEKTHTKMHNIVVMASANTINSDSFAALRNADENNRPFLTGIDPTELIKLYAEFGESVSKQLYIRLASLLYMTLELAAGKEPPQTPIIVSYDKKMRILILLPKADPIDYEALKNNYAAEKFALQAA